MAEKMSEAEWELEGKAKQSVRNFLKDASLAQIQCKMVYHKEDSIQAALVNRNPIGWEERSAGLCLVGGNTVKSDEVSTLGGCWNGGELIKDASAAVNRTYGSVPHGPENCIRCRWFITEARYLPALNAQFNQLSYKAHQAANLSVEIEGELEALKDEQFFCEEQGTPFTKHSELQTLQRRHEKQQVEADEYAKDWIACFELISKIIRVEEARNDDDTKDKLIAVGNEQDISHALKFVETESELLHLSLLCDDAEFFPDLQDELRKTPAIEKRSRQLSRALMKKGFEPIFMEMDEKQQLIAGNAMLRQMAKIADPDDKMEGYRKVANYIEAGEYLSNHKLFNAGMNALSDKALRLEKSHPTCAIGGLMDINIDIILADLKTTKCQEPKKNLDKLNDILKAYIESGQRDFSIAQMGRVSAAEGGPGYEALRATKNKHYRTLIEAWAAKCKNNHQKAVIANLTL